MRPKLQPFGKGVRLVQHGCVLSEILREPGPTHSIFDLLAAAVVCFGPGPRLAMLGFAGGGMMAPLRKLGGEHLVEAVDLDADGYGVFKGLAGAWAGGLQFEEDDAVRWLRAHRVNFDVIVEDLSISEGGDVVKPAVCWEVLPALMARRLRTRRLLVSNLLPTPAISMAELERQCHVVEPACVVEFDRFQNRVLLQGSEIGSARQVGQQLREMLEQLGSRLADGISVRSLGAVASD